MIRKVRILFKLLIENICVRIFLRRKTAHKKYKFSICAIFKNESIFLKEWIDYHKLLGVEHFYLYNNNSSDDFYSVLFPYINDGVVSLFDWPYEQKQIEAYQNFYTTKRYETQWVTFLDIDEFICPKYSTNILDWIDKHSKYPVNLIYWRMFGSSGKLIHDVNALVIEQYTICWDFLYNCGKCIINTDYDIAEYNCTTHHLTKIKYPILWGLFHISLDPVNPFGIFVRDPFHFSMFCNKTHYDIQINHYWSKGWNEFDKKRHMSDVYFKNNPKKDISYFFEHEYNNRIANYDIYRFLMKLKLYQNGNK